MIESVSDALKKLEPSPTDSEIAREKLGKISALHEPREVVEWVGPDDDDFGKFDICGECHMPWPCGTYRVITDAPTGD